MNVLDCVEVKMHFPVGKRALLHAVDDVSFSIGEGESVGLVGESGCGKSTLVRLVARMLDPTAGDIIYRGRNIGFIPSRSFAGTQFRRRIQMVFQDATDSLNPRHTAFDAIAEPVRRLGTAGNLAGQVVDTARKVGLPEELLPRYPHQLSGGQKARVGIARAIALHPKLVILDEPTAALDARSEQLLQTALDQLTRGRTTFVIAHRLATIRNAGRILVFDGGRIIESGTFDELVERGGHFAEIARSQFMAGEPAKVRHERGQPAET